jgi:uncharacterized protein YggU (UPF0235/DUF167 family)
VRVRVKVNAGSRSESVRLLERDFYQVRTRAPAEGGRANERVLELLAEELGVPPSSLRIVTGHTRPLKLIEIEA